MTFAACHAAEVDLDLSGLMALKHIAASFEAAQRGDAKTSYAEAKAACDRLSADEMSDEVSDEVGSSLLSLSVHLYQTGYVAEARSLLATLLGGEEAISSRQTIADALGDEATPELVDQLHLVASGLSALPPIDPPEGPSAGS